MKKRRIFDDEDAARYAEIDEKERIGDFLDTYLKPEIDMTIPAKTAKFKNNLDIPRILNVMLNPIENLYTHQHDAVAELMNGRNCILTTSTSSGKSLVYQITSV